MECLTSLATEAVTKLGNLIVEPTVKQFEYLINHKKIIANLKEEHEQLKLMKQALQGRVNADIRNELEIAPNVLKWLSDVEAIENKLQIFNDEVSKNKKCFGGKCPNVAFNYSLGKRATKRTQDIVSLKEEENNFQDPIAYPKAPPPLGSMFTEDIKYLESRNKIMTEVIEKLKNDKFKRISICGMGGVGKTTLVKELVKVVETTKLFDEVVMAVVSQDPKYEDIQSQIADRLGLKFKTESKQGKASELLERLNGKQVLIVLDDVWKKLEFEKIGLASSLEYQEGYKIIFTSRNEDVCNQMGSQSNSLVSILHEDEAWYLFREMAGRDAVEKPDINPIAKQLKKECGGLPLAIVAVGRALGDKEKPAWENALVKLRNSQLSSFSDIQEFVYSRIELSIDFLGSEEQKSCLLLCGLFPEDFDIPVESVMRYGVGLGLFKVFGALRNARNEVHTLVGNLKRCFLLMDSDEPECVKMHDVVRDVIISMASREEHWFMVQHNAELKGLAENNWDRLQALSLILNEAEELENVSGSPRLKLLQVRSQRKKQVPWLEDFTQGMSKLRVLALQDLGISKTPSLFQPLVNLHTLQVEGCDVGDISIIGKEFKKLQILSFANSSIKELPTEIGELGSLRLLDLTGCNHLDIVSTNVLTRLSQLEELYFNIRNFPWMLNKDVLIEVRNLSQQLKVLEIRVRKLEVLPNDLIFQKLEKFWVYIAPFTIYERHGYLESNMIQLTATNYKSVKCSLMTMQLVKKCEVLILEKMKDLRNVISELDDSGLQYLKDLRIDSCSNLEYLVDSSSHCNAFPLLYSLSLKHLDNLGALCYVSDHSNVKESMINFTNLVELKLVALPSLIAFSTTIDLKMLHHPIPNEPSSATELAKSAEVEDGGPSSRSHSKQGDRISSPIKGKLFSSNWMKQFPKLETILLEYCSSLEMVFDLQGYSQSNGQSPGVLFPQLKEIKISNLNELTHVWGNAPCCDEGFQNLRSLIISSCDSLRYVFTPAVARAITKLEQLEVLSCKLMENLVAWSREDEEDNNKSKGKLTNIVFNKLYSISLKKLPKLESICPDSCKLEWPSLRKFHIDDCPMLKISLLPAQMPAKRDNHGVTSHANTEDTGFQSFKENNSWSFNFPLLGCMPLLPKSVQQGPTNKSSKEVSIAESYVPSKFEMKSNLEIGQMPILEDLKVRRCDFLDLLFLLEDKYNSTNLSSLKTIKIEECDKLDSIMAKGEERMDMTNSFTQLESLHLNKLPNLVRFSFPGTCTSLDKSEDMGLCEGDDRRTRCDPLINGFLFPHLTSLLIEGCGKINILLSYSTLRSLECLEKLEVAHCDNIEEIVCIEEKVASVNKLQRLVLRGLPNLKAFCQGSYDFDFSSLQQVKIEDCPNIEVFSRGSSHTPKLEDFTMGIKTYRSSYMLKGDLNAAIQGFKAFVESQASEMLSWRVLRNESLLKTNIEGFHKLSRLVSFDEIHILQHLRELQIIKCDSLVGVFESDGRVDRRKGDATTRHELQSMYLSNLPKLRHIWGPNIMWLESFQNLTSIRIGSCHSLKSLLSYSMAKSLVKLQELHVYNCEIMEEIVAKEDEKFEEGSKVKELFPKLETLSLYDLPNLKCVCSGEYDYDLPLYEDKEMITNNAQVEISFPELMVLQLHTVPNLKCFCSGAYDYDLLLSSSHNEEYPQITAFPTANVAVNTPNLVRVYASGIAYFGSNMMVLGNPLMYYTMGDLNLTIHYIQDSKKYEVELQKLETFRCIEQDQFLHGYITRVTVLVLESCDKLLNCIPSNMLHKFQHLYVLTVRQCGSLEEIFESEGAGANDNDYEGDSILQYELNIMELDSLPKLKHIWKNHVSVLGFQSLMYLIIRGCHDLKYVFPDISIIKSLTSLFKLEVCECNKMEEIIQNNPIQEPPKEAKIIFPQLRELSLEKLPNLNCFCASSCYVEMPQCYRISIEECPEMKSFCYGTLYTPAHTDLSVEDTKFPAEEDINEAIEKIRRR